MADYDTSRGAKKKETSDAKSILAQARTDWDRAMARERDNIIEAYYDLEFLAGENYCQWDLKARQDREKDGRPTLQINTLPQFVHQITGDMRQMKPALKFVPVDNEADEKRADIIGGLVRYIENRSDAPGVYNRAGDSQVACGVGAWRVKTEYADETTFNQEIRIAPIEDGVSVLFDPDASQPCREDAKFCFVPVDMSRELFKEKYPNIVPNAFADETWAENIHWCTDDYVRVAEYWKHKPVKRTLVLMDDGRILDLTDEADKDAQIAKLQEMAQLLKVEPPRVEMRDSFRVCRYLITASDVLEEEDWVGRLIPIVPVVGEEIRIGRKLIRKGIVRNSRDPQRMVNYFHSAHTETVALQPKAPFIGTEKNFARFQGMWEEANTKNLPYLIYDPDQANNAVAPQRVQPPVSSQGVLDGLTLATQSQKQVIGIYDPGLGAKSNETSGKAIEARQREGDVGSFVYIDNFARAIRRTGQILVDLIPHVYDAERAIRIMGEDGKIDVIDINKAEGIGDEAKILNDVTVGAYDVVAEVGPSYSTKREQAREGMAELLRTAPDLAPLIMDMVVKALDMPMADAIAKRIRATLPPHILAMEEAEKQGMDPEQARQAALEQMKPPPDPKIVESQRKAEEGMAKLQLEQEKFAVEMEKERAQMVADMQQQREQLKADMDRAVLDAMTKIEVAQINAGVGMHKVIVDAATAEYGKEVDAAVAKQKMDADERTKARDQDVRAATAKYQTDNRPQPSGGT